MQRILVVEDEPEMADLLEMALEMQGYRVVKVHGTRLAMQSLINDRPDAVVLDLMMPDVSGLEFCRFARRDPRFEKLPIVICSAKVQPEDIEEGMSAGATAYFKKPMAIADLVKALADSMAAD